jgi:FixJ family two-component response regulator
MAKDSTTESCGANVTMDIYLPKCSGMTLQARICDNMEETKGNQ